MADQDISTPTSAMAGTDSGAGTHTFVVPNVPHTVSLPADTDPSIVNRTIGHLVNGYNAVANTVAPYAESLGRSVTSAADAITQAPDAIKAAFTQPATDDEKRLLGVSDNPSLAEHLALGIARASGASSIGEAAKYYKTALKGHQDLYGTILKNAPEALGSGAGTVLLGRGVQELFPQPKVAPTVQTVKPTAKVSPIETVEPTVPLTDDQLVQEVIKQHFPDAKSEIQSGELGNIESAKISAAELDRTIRATLRRQRATAASQPIVEQGTEPTAVTATPAEQSAAARQFLKTVPTVEGVELEGHEGEAAGAHETNLAGKTTGEARSRSQMLSDDERALAQAYLDNLERIPTKIEQDMEALRLVRERLGLGKQTPDEALKAAVKPFKQVEAKPQEIDLTPELRRFQQEQLAKKGVSGGSDADAPTFYSKAARVAFEKVPNSASGDQILATLRNNGVKENEIGWLGLDDYLKGKPKVSKADVQQYINEHKIQLEEVTKGGANAEAIRALKQQREKVYAENNRIWSDHLRYADGTANLFNAMKEGADVEPIIATMPEDLQPHARRFIETDKAIHDLDAKEEALNRGDSPELAAAHSRLMSALSKFKDMTKTELQHVFGLDERSASGRADVVKNEITTGSRSSSEVLHDEFKSYLKGKTPSQELLSSGRDLFNYNQDYRHAQSVQRANPNRTKYDQYTLAGEKRNYTEMLLKLPQKAEIDKPVFSVKQSSSGQDWHVVNDRGGEVLTVGTREYAERRAAELNEQGLPPHLRGRDGRNFTTSHFPDDPNVLAHVRFDDRSALDGKKTLFLEELQSDWHSRGKREGYASPPASPSDIDVKYIPREKGQDPAIYPGYWESFDKRTGQLITRHGGVMDEPAVRKEALTFANLPTKKVPDAPFKTDWHELAIKRLLRHAAENGYERLAWTTGDQQAARYDLSKHISELSYDPDTEYLYAKDMSGKHVINEPVSLNDLPDYIGKEPAAKLVKEIESHRKATEYDRSQWSVEPEEENFVPKPEDKISQQRAVNALSWGHKVTMGMPAEFGYNYTTIDNPNQLQYAPKGAEFFSGAKSFVIRDPNGDLLYGQGGKPEFFDTAKEANEHIDLMLLRDRQASGDTLPKLSGLDLKVGGEWARNLYDKAIVNFLNKYAKKWGAKVGETQLGSQGQYVIEHNPKYTQESWHVVQTKPTRQLLGTFKTQDYANSYLHDLEKAAPKVHSIEITPAMKKSVMKEGQPIAEAQPKWSDGLAATLARPQAA